MYMHRKVVWHTSQRKMTLKPHSFVTKLLGYLPIEQCRGPADNRENSDPRERRDESLNYIVPENPKPALRYERGYYTGC